MIGFLFNRIEYSQKCVAFLSQMHNKPIICYYNDVVALSQQPTFPMFESIYGYTHKDVLISTCLETTKNLLMFRAVPKKIFYVWDYEWLYKTFDAAYLYNLYMNPQIELLARSTDSFNIIKNTWKKPIGIMEEFNHGQISQLLEYEQRTAEAISKPKV